MGVRMINKNTEMKKIKEDEDTLRKQTKWKNIL